MKLGIGGRVGPIRLGISTRGVGGGLGPFSVGGAWPHRHRRRRRPSSRAPRAARATSAGTPSTGGGEVFLVLLGLVAAYFLIAWPWLLGVKVASGLGAAPGSNVANTVAWGFEIAYLAVIISVAVVVSRRRRAALEATMAAQVAAEQARAEAEQAAVQAAEMAAKLHAAREAAHASQSLLAALEQYPGDHNYLVPTEASLYAMDDAELIAYRVAYRNGPRVPMVIERGVAEFTDAEIRFVSVGRTVRWKLARVNGVTWGADFFMVSVAGRKAIYGLGASPPRFPVLSLAFEWAHTMSLDGSLTAVRTNAKALHDHNTEALHELTGGGVQETGAGVQDTGAGVQETEMGPEGMVLGLGDWVRLTGKLPDRGFRPHLGSPPQS